MDKSGSNAFLLGAALVSAGGLLWWISQKWSSDSNPSTQYSTCHISSSPLTQSYIDTDQPLSSSTPVTMITFVPTYLVVTVRDGNAKIYDGLVHIQISFFSVSPPYLEMSSVVDIHPENRRKMIGISEFSVVPRTIGNFNVRINLNGKEINKSPFPVTVLSDLVFYEEFPIIIDPALDKTNLIIFPRHSDQPSLRISQIDFPPLLEAISTTKDYWPRGPKLLYQIVLDYGRSHYFFTNGSDHVPRQIHEYGFRNFGTATPEQCISFFDNLGISGGDQVLRRFDEGPTPVRSNLLTRIKFELLRKFLSENGKTPERSSELAIAVMAGTTQHTLSYLKHHVINRIPGPLQSVIRFVWYRVNITVRKNHVFLEVTFLNFLPREGTWQISPGEKIPRNNRKRIRAEFLMDLEVEDNGKIIISIEGDHEAFGRVGPEEGGEKYGIYRADMGDVIKFRDTAPTW